MLKPRSGFQSVRRSLKRVLTREYNFASTQYASCFGNLPEPDTDLMRKQAVDYCDAFDKKTWYDRPMVTVLKGKRHDSGVPMDSTDAFKRVIGKQVNSDPATVDAVIEHLKNFIPSKDYRKQARAIEDDLLANYAGALIGNQAMDFMKQDGVTEVGEWAQACIVERRLADKLLADEAEGKLDISRSVAFVGCVSNFSNFLDVSRKVLRNVELGVPVCVLSRSNTSQHMFRWFEMLAELADKHQLDQSMLTFLSAKLPEKNRVMHTFPTSPFYLTGSRETAADIIKTSPNLMASTGGPNTMVATDMTPNIKDAVQLSTLIENSGQCTAMRHLACAENADIDVEAMFGGAPRSESGPDALKKGKFASLFNEQPIFTVDSANGYKKHPDLPLCLRVNNDGAPDQIEEMWREAYLDVTTGIDFNSAADIDKLAAWLNHHQPISLAVNGKAAPYELFKRIFDRTALLVYTCGSDEFPALTCQAQPQNGEIFGEFPPRAEMGTYTKFPMVVPTPGPAYNSFYTENYLVEMSRKKIPRSGKVETLAAKIKDPKARGYVQVVLEYLVDACQENPKRGSDQGPRTALFGLQRPPVNSVNVVRGDDLDGVLIRLLPFLATNGKEGVSVSSSCQTVVDALSSVGVDARLESDAEFKGWVSKNNPWNILETPKTEEFCLAGQFVSLLFPLGHVKSAKKGDDEFLRVMASSRKWLTIEG